MPRGATNAATTYEARPSVAQRYLVVSELMYRPGGSGLAEFVEILNIAPDVTVDLRGVRFTRGVEFDFTGSAVTSLPPGGRVVVVRDLAAFAASYGTRIPVAGAFANGTALSNGGERIKLEDAENGTIAEFTYDDVLPWPVAGDAGYSLVLIDPETHPDPDLAAHWRPSARPGGSPGGPDRAGAPTEPNADADGNGESDLVDYALGNDLGLPPYAPRLGPVSGPSGVATDLGLIHTVSLSAEKVDLRVYFSTDLVRWQEAADHLEAVSRQALGDGRELVVWRIKPPLRDEPRVFLRFGAVARAN